MQARLGRLRFYSLLSLEGTKVVRRMRRSGGGVVPVNILEVEACIAPRRGMAICVGRSYMLVCVHLGRGGYGSNYAYVPRVRRTKRMERVPPPTALSNSDTTTIQSRWVIPSRLPPVQSTGSRPPTGALERRVGWCPINQVSSWSAVDRTRGAGYCACRRTGI